MIQLIISLLASLSVGFFIKSLRINNVRNLFTMVTANYFVATILSLLCFKIQLNPFYLQSVDLKSIISLGILMPSIFFVLNKSLKTSGLARTDIFQRLSLLIPVLLSFTLFNEELTLAKLVVVTLAFASILLLLYKKSTNNGKSNILFLLAVFFGYGIIDTLFKIIATNKSINYTSVLFLIFILCSFISFLYILFLKGKIQKKYCFFGIVLGLLNFSNIYFYMEAHKKFSHSPTLVFITMNLGVIIGGSLIGAYYFKEKLSKVTIYGILMAILSIILLALIQLNLL